jgi:uncharacterized phage-associated protein
MQNHMTTPYDGRAVANFVLDFCDDRSVGVTNLALQKIVYFSHVWSLVRLKRPLVRHKFEAWEYGPVLPYLYREFRSFDRVPIKGRATQIDPSTGVRRVVPYCFAADMNAQLQEIVAFYSRVRASDLVKLSHVVGGPWYRVWNHGGNINPGMKIDDASIAEFYSRVPSPYSLQ